MIHRIEISNENDLLRHLRSKVISQKYDYLLYTLHILFIEGKLKLKDDKCVEDFIKLKSMVSKDYHHQIEYSMLDGENNEIVKNNSYVKSKYKSRLKFNKIDKIETK